MTCFLVALSVSIDAFCVGSAFGLKKVFISRPVQALIGFVCFLCAYVSIKFGVILKLLLPGHIVGYAGGVVLALIAFIGLIREYRPGRTSGVHMPRQREDSSGNNVLDAKNAILLGISLALDVFGAGIGLALDGEQGLLYPILASVIQVIALYLGVHLGEILQEKRKIRPESHTPQIVSSGVIFLMAILRVLT